MIAQAPHPSQQRAVAGVRPRDLVCTCMALDPHELLTAWRRRAAPVVRRLAARGRAIDQARVAATLRLVMLIDGGSPEAFAPENWHRSHHRPGCPCGGRRTPLAALDLSPEARWESP